MKTQLIPLAAHDDLISIRDRMSWAKTPRILLVWPKSERIPLRPLDLKVLQRHAAVLGAQLGLVTRHRKIRREAAALGIPVFISTGQAQRNPWPERRLRKKRPRRVTAQALREKREQVRVQEEAWRDHPVARITFFALGVLAVLVMASLFIPQAQIVLTPETETQTATLPIVADPSIEKVFITGSVPSRVMRVTVEGSQEAAVTGKVPVPLAKARGIVTFRNLTNEPVNIPSGTVLTSTGLPGVRFVTTEAGKLEAGLQETVDVPVEAENPGSSGNVGTGAIQAIEGNLGLQATVSNPEPTTGGTNRMMDAATERDLSAVREKLLFGLEEKALQDMRAALAPGDQIFMDTVKGQMLEENVQPPLGQPGMTVTLSLRVEYVASYATEKDLIELASTVLNASIPNGFAATQAPFQFEAVTDHRTDERGVTRWSLRVSRGLEKKVDSGKIIPLVQGRDPEKASARLNDTLGLSKPAEIRLQPAWWPWLPLIPFNIRIQTR